MKIILLTIISSAIFLSGCGTAETEKESSVSGSESSASEAFYVEGTVYEIYDSYIYMNCNKIGETCVYLSDMDNAAEMLEKLNTGDTVKIRYDGSVAESYPAQIHHVYDVEVIDEADKN